MERDAEAPGTEAEPEETPGAASGLNEPVLAGAADVETLTLNRKETSKMHCRIPGGSATVWVEQYDSQGKRLSRWKRKKAVMFSSCQRANMTNWTSKLVAKVVTKSVDNKVIRVVHVVDDEAVCAAVESVMCFDNYNPVGRLARLSTTAQVASSWRLSCLTLCLVMGDQLFSHAAALERPLSP